jgi:putative addiction module component (TIGR02574 family)
VSTLLFDLSERARALPAAERAQLAEDLLASLQEATAPDVEAAWDQEILRRLEEVDRGVATLVPAEDVFAQARRVAQ